MFGNKTPQNPTPPRRSAADVAQIQGGGLVQVIVTHVHPLEFYLFLNDVYVPQMEIESFSLSIESPTSSNPTGVVRATLARMVQNVSGQMAPQRQELFPCTLEVIAIGRRLSITATQPDSVEGLWIDLGLRADGTSSELSGVQALRLLISDGWLDAKLTWEDGEVEDLLPHELA